MASIKLCSSCKCRVDAVHFGAEHAKTCSSCLSKRRQTNACKLGVAPPEGQRMCSTCKHFCPEDVFDAVAPKTCPGCREKSQMRNKRRRAQQKAKLDLPWVGLFGVVGENQGLSIMSEVAAVRVTSTNTLQMPDCRPTAGSSLPRGRIRSRRSRRTC